MTATAAGRDSVASNPPRDLGLDWARSATSGLRLIFGSGTVVLPFYPMQPGMGPASPPADAARLQSLVTHAVFGIGFYALGVVVMDFLLRAGWVKEPLLQGLTRRLDAHAVFGLGGWVTSFLPPLWR